MDTDDAEIEVMKVQIQVRQKEVCSYHTLFKKKYVHKGNNVWLGKDPPPVDALVRP